MIEVCVTASPEDAVPSGLIANMPLGAKARVATLCALKVIVCALAPTLNDCATDAAALLLASPIWSATMVQLPTASSVTLVPLTLQVSGVLDEKATVSVDVAVAEMASGDWVTLCAPGLLNVIVWLRFCTVNVNDCVGAPLALVAVIVSG